MTPENAYKEALRRIREAEETGAVELDLRGASSSILEVLPSAPFYHCRRELWQRKEGRI